MTDKGLVSELPFANVTRFEANTRSHANLVCRRCGAIEDWDLVDQALLAELQSRVVGAASFRPEAQRIDIYGICRNCS
jgi:Fe2+ or Zn2+ uptake regulation protein